MSQPVRIRLKHLKLKPFHYLSQLDITRLWDRLIRRNAVPIEFSQGFNPRPRMSFGPALALGIQSYAEWVEFFFSRPVDLERFFMVCYRELPRELRPVSIIELHPADPGFARSISGVNYRFLFTGLSQELPPFPDTPWTVKWHNPISARTGFMVSCIFQGTDYQLSPQKFWTTLEEDHGFPHPIEIIKADVLFER